MRKTIFLLIILALNCLTARAGTNPFLPYMPSARDSIDLLLSRDGTYRYGYINCVPQNERAMYLQVLDSIANFQDNHTALGLIYNRVTVSPTVANWPYKDYAGVTSFMDMMKRLYRDMPEMYLLSSYIPRYNSTYSEYYVRVMESYKPSVYAQELAVIDSVVSGIVEQANLLTSEYDKVLFLHDTLCQITRYGDMSGAFAGSIKGVFINRRAVCEGWARSFLFLCQKAGINCIYVDGRINMNPGESPTQWGNHAWNHVQVDGKWYLVDATSDGALGGVGHRCFLKGQAFFNDNYSYVTGGSLGSGDDNIATYPTMPTLAAVDYVPTPTSLTSSSSSAGEGSRKRIVNNQLLIEREGVQYTVIGCAVTH